MSELLFRRSANRAVICACAAADAGVSVDYVLAVALGDAANRAAICASTARNALIGNLVCHF